MIVVRVLLLAAYWAIVLAACVAVELAVPLPFSGPAADLMGVTAATGIALIGYAYAPTLRKDHA